MKIRRAKSQDTAHVKRLIMGIFEEEFPHDMHAYNYNDLEDISRTYGSSREAFFVAEEKGAIVGTVAIKEDDSKTALLRRIFVAAQSRNKGYGSLLMKHAIAFAQEHKYHRIIFRGTFRMQKALELCKQHGFVEQDAIPFGNGCIFTYTKELIPIHNGTIAE